MRIKLSELARMPEAERDRVLSELMKAAKARGPMTEQERREQRADWAYGQMACMSRYSNATTEELAELRALCRKEAGLS